MFRSTHKKLMQEAAASHRLEMKNLREQLVEKHMEEKQTLQASLSAQKRMTAAVKAEKIEKGFSRPIRDMADTLIRALHETNRMIFEYPNWDELPTDYRDHVYDIMYKLLGRQRKSSQKSTRK